MEQSSVAPFVIAMQDFTRAIYESLLYILDYYRFEFLVRPQLERRGLARDEGVYPSVHEAIYYWKQRQLRQRSCHGCMFQ